jgi:hypothetical protein
MGGIYGAVREIRTWHHIEGVVRTYIAFVVHMGPVSARHEYNTLAKAPTEDMNNVHHREVRMTFDSWLADTNCWVTL